MADLPGHRWKHVEDITTDEGNFFVYQCSKCPARTLNGKALPPIWNKRCGK